jgi:beta-N-acetylhexosaminidase
MTLKRVLYAGVFAIATMTAMAARAQTYSGADIGGDLNWPAVPIIDEQTVPPAKLDRKHDAPRIRDSAPNGAQAAVSRPEPSGASRPSVSNGALDANQSRGPNEPPQLARQETSNSPTPPIPERLSRPGTPPPTLPHEAMAEQALTATPPDDRIGKIIGQMIMVGFDGVQADQEGPRSVATQIESGQIGGVVFARQNLDSPDQIKRLTGAFRSVKAEISPFLAINEEGGVSHGLPPQKGFRTYPPAGDLGRTNDPLMAYSIYQSMAAELASYGFNLNMGPVVDLYRGDPVSLPPEGGSSYGSEPKPVAAFATAFRLAHADAGLLTVLKHFPGQADAGLTPAALEPYRQLNENGNVDIIMVANAVPAGPPSPNAIQKVLREDIKYQGVIMSDDLNAADLAGKLTLSDRVLGAIRVGVDVLLFGDNASPPPDLPEKVAEIVKNGVASGTLSRERLEQSYARITELKQRLNAANRAVASVKDESASKAPPR